MSRLRRFELQNHAARLLPSELVAGCLRRTTFMADEVDLRYYPEEHSASYRGLQRCSSVWHCPICATRISEGRRAELARLVEKHIASGGSVWMTTYTIRHDRYDDLADLLANFLEARRKAKGGRRGVALRRDFQVIGTVSVLEVTWSRENGWHPHVHELVFSADPNFDPDAYDQMMRAAWEHAAAALGLHMNEHGFQIDRTYGAVADYIAKYGREPVSDRPWGVESEVTKGHTKRGRVTQHYTPFALLEAIADGHSDLEPCFKEYARRFKGRKQLTYSPGLKARYAEEEKSDEELLLEREEAEAKSLDLVSFPPEEWAAVVEHNVRGALLELGRRGLIGDIIEGLAEIGVNIAPRLAPGWRVSTPKGIGSVSSVLYEAHRGRWRCSVWVDQPEGTAPRWQAFDLVDVRVLSGAPLTTAKEPGV
jgi:hypothetical protein